MEINTFEELVICDKVPISFAEGQHIEDLLSRILGTSRGEGSDAFRNECIRRCIQFIHSRWDFDIVLREHVLIEVEHDKFTIIGDAIEIAAAHDASLRIIQAGGLNAGGKDLIPTALGSFGGHISEQAVHG